MGDSVNLPCGCTYSAAEFMVLWQIRSRRALLQRRNCFYPKAGPLHQFWYALIFPSGASTDTHKNFTSFSTCALGSKFLLESIYWSETSEVYKNNRNKAVPSLIWDFFLCYFLSLKGFAVSYCLLRCSLEMLPNRCQESVKHKIVWIKICSN